MEATTTIEIDEVSARRLDDLVAARGARRGALAAEAMARGLRVLELETVVRTGEPDVRALQVLRNVALAATRGLSAQLMISVWNKACPPGTPVLYRSRPGEALERFVTRSAAELLGGHTPVVWVDGKPGCVALTHLVRDVPRGHAVPCAGPPQQQKDTECSLCGAGPGAAGWSYNGYFWEHACPEQVPEDREPGKLVPFRRGQNGRTA